MRGNRICSTKKKGVNGVENPQKGGLYCGAYPLWPSMGVPAREPWQAVSLALAMDMACVVDSKRHFINMSRLEFQIKRSIEAMDMFI